MYPSKAEGGHERCLGRYSRVATRRSDFRRHPILRPDKITDIFICQFDQTFQSAFRHGIVPRLHPRLRYLRGESRESRDIGNGFRRTGHGLLRRSVRFRQSGTSIFLSVWGVFLSGTGQICSAWESKMSGLFEFFCLPRKDQACFAVV